MSPLEAPQQPKYYSGVRPGMNPTVTGSRQIARA